jgi:Flp pilus assembly pilin Flp
MSLRKLLGRLHADERGLAETEYTILLVLVVIGTLGVMARLGGYLGAYYEQYELYTALPLP